MKLAWPPSLRHTREMFAAVQAAGGEIKPLAEAKARDIGDLVFSRLLQPGTGPSIVHVSILTGFTDTGEPIALQVQASYEGLVVERPLIITAEQQRERFIASASLLAELALAA